MSLYVFSTAVLSIVFMMVFGSWWVESAPFRVHLSALVMVAITVLSIILMIAVYPTFKRHNKAKRHRNKIDSMTWAADVSANLSTPAAVIKGYNVVFANKSFLAELGMQGLSDQIVGMPITNIIHASDHQHLAVLFSQDALQQENKESMKLRFLSLDGTILPAYITISPLEAESNTDLNLLQFSSNSMQNMQEFVYVDASNHQYLINEIEQLVFHLNVNQQILFLNQSWESQLDYKVQDSLNQNILTFIHPEDRPLAEARINSLIQGKRNKSTVEVRLISRNGESHWMELRAKNTSTYKGERSSVIGTLTDISHTKATEASLRSNRHLLTTLINNTAGMMYRCKNDQHWSFEFVSDGCVDVTGYEPYEMINNPNFSYMQIIHSDDRQLTWEVVQRKVNEQQKFQVIYRIVNRSGAVKWVWEQGKGVFSSSGELLALEGFITDITNHDHPEILQAFQSLFFNPGSVQAKLN